MLTVSVGGISTVNVNLVLPFIGITGLLLDA